MVLNVTAPTYRASSYTISVTKRNVIETSEKEDKDPGRGGEGGEGAQLDTRLVKSRSHT